MATKAELRVAGDQSEVKQAARSLQMLKPTANIAADDIQPLRMVFIQQG
jgi:hypothetical protein